MDVPQEIDNLTSKAKATSNRNLCFAIFGVTTLLYGAFVVNKLLLVTASPKEVVIKDETNRFSAKDFYHDTSKLTNEQYVLAAQAADRDLLAKVGKKYPAPQPNERNPRSVWYRRVKDLEEYHSKVDDKRVYKVDSRQRREYQRMLRVKADKPEI